MFTLEVSEIIRRKLGEDFELLQRAITSGEITFEKLKATVDSYAREFGRPRPGYGFFLTEEDRAYSGELKLVKFREYLTNVLYIENEIFRECIIIALIQGAQVKINDEIRNVDFAFSASNSVNRGWLPEIIAQYSKLEWTKEIDFTGRDDLIPQIEYDPHAKSVCISFADDTICHSEGTIIGRATYAMTLFEDLYTPPQFRYQMWLEDDASISVGSTRIFPAHVVKEYFKLDNLFSPSDTLANIISKLVKIESIYDMRLFLTKIILHDTKGDISAGLMNEIKNFDRYTLSELFSHEYVLELARIIRANIEYAENTSSVIILMTALARLSMWLSPVSFSVMKNDRYLITREELLDVENEYIRDALVNNDWSFYFKDDEDLQITRVFEYDYRRCGIRINEINSIRKYMYSPDELVRFLQHELQLTDCKIIYARYSQRLLITLNYFTSNQEMVPQKSEGVVCIYGKQREFYARSVLWGLKHFHQHNPENIIIIPGVIECVVKLEGKEYLFNKVKVSNYLIKALYLGKDIPINQYTIAFAALEEQLRIILENDEAYPVEVRHVVQRALDGIIRKTDVEPHPDWEALIKLLQYVRQIILYFSTVAPAAMNPQQYFSLTESNEADRELLVYILDHCEFTNPIYHRQKRRLLDLILHFPEPDGSRLITQYTIDNYNRMLQTFFIQGSATKDSIMILELGAEKKGMLRLLSSDIVDQLYKLRYHPQGRHKVVRIESSDDLGRLRVSHWKLMPEQSGNAYAVEQLAWRVCGGGTIMSSIAKYTAQGQLAFAVQISPHAGDESLDVVFHSAKEKLKQLDMASFTRHLLRVLLVNPEDDKENDYFLVPYTHYDGSVRYRLERIDNDRAFFDPEEKGWRPFKDELLVKSILLCLDQMQQSLDDTVINEFLSLDPDITLERWLKDLDKLHYQYQILFTLEEFKWHFLHQQPGSSLLMVYLAKERFAQLQDRFATLQEICRLYQKQQCPILGIDLLEILQPDLAKYYRPMFKKYPPVNRPELAAVRFRELTKDAYYDSKMFNCDAVSKSLDLKKRLTLPEAIAIRSGDKDSPGNALELLRQQKVRCWDSICADVLQGDFTEFQQLTMREQRRILKLFYTQINNSITMPFNPEEQSNILCAMANIPFVTLDLQKFALVLNNDLLIPILRCSGSRLLHLDISNCQYLTARTLIALSMYCRNLMTLNFSHSRIKHFQSYQSARKIYDFPNLIHLRLTNCPDLETLQIIAPKLDLTKFPYSRIIKKRNQKYMILPVVAQYYKKKPNLNKDQETSDSRTSSRFFMPQEPAVTGRTRNVQPAVMYSHPIT